MSDSEMGWEFLAYGPLEQAMDRWLYPDDEDGLPALLFALELAAHDRAPEPRWVNGWAGTDSGIR
jgi:hypothetical protein